MKVRPGHVWPSPADRAAKKLIAVVADDISVQAKALTEAVDYDLSWTVYWRKEPLLDNECAYSWPAAQFQRVRASALAGFRQSVEQLPSGARGTTDDPAAEYAAAG